MHNVADPACPGERYPSVLRLKTTQPSAVFTRRFSVKDLLYCLVLAVAVNLNAAQLLTNQVNFEASPINALPGAEALASPRQIFIGQLLNAEEDNFAAWVEGRVSQVKSGQDGGQLRLSVGNAHMNVNVTGNLDLASTNLMNRLIRAVGICQGAYTTEGLRVPHLLRVTSWRQIEILDALPSVKAATNAPLLPTLTTAEEVHRLPRIEAKRAYPVKIRGVVTGVESAFHALIVQDASRGLYFNISNVVQDIARSPDSPMTNSVQAGDFVEVAGATDPGFFAPNVLAEKMVRLGLGQLPEPIHPTWDQLLNGSMDAQFVEIQGVVSAATNWSVSLLTPSGVIQVIVTRDGRRTGELATYLNSMITLRGVLLAQWNRLTHQVTVGEIRICDPVVVVDRAATADVFDVPRRTPSELLLFDPRASLFQRVCVSGQIVHLGEEESFLMAGSNGLRFVANELDGIQVGDKVDVSGLPELGGASPVLRDAVVRKTGHALLPKAIQLTSTNLNNAEWDSTRVCVEGELIGQRETPKEITLDMQSEGGRFVARLASGYQASRSLPKGCQLELTGVFVVRNQNKISDARGALFELLLDSPANIRVLARPPWWTPRRLATMVGLLISVLVASALWITQLRRRVDQRTMQLEEQIQQRQLIEQHRAMEHERARIAKDLHDELGSSLTEVSLLASIPVTAQNAQTHINQVGAKAKQMVGSLDEIVWAMNPKHDSLDSVGKYFCLYADRILALAGIKLLLRGDPRLPNQALNPIHRHELFLAFKEALNNVVRHSGATEVSLGLRIINGKVRVSLIDNGRGFKPVAPVENRNGLTNMRARLEKMGGRFSISSTKGQGTVLRFYAPLNSLSAFSAFL